MSVTPGRSNRNECVEQCGVEPAAGHTPRLDSASHEQHGVVARVDQVTRVGVETRHLAVGQEPAPSLLEFGDATLGEVEQVVVTVDHDHVDVRPHGAPASFECGRSGVHTENRTWRRCGRRPNAVKIR
jgi:hypothetical protein